MNATDEKRVVRTAKGKVAQCISIFLIERLKKAQNKGSETACYSVFEGLF